MVSSAHFILNFLAWLYSESWHIEHWIVICELAVQEVGAVVAQAVLPCDLSEFTTVDPADLVRFQRPKDDFSVIAADSNQACIIFKPLDGSHWALMTQK